MKAVTRLLFLCMIPLFLSGCLQDSKESNQPINTSDLKPPVNISVEEAEAKIPFEIKQPSVPFHVTQQSARILDTNGEFDAIEITYANSDEGINLIIMITNSQIDTPPTGKKGLKLTNGSQTWDQGNEHVSAIYWRNEGLTYSLISGKNNNLEPLYDYQTLIDIANTLN
ncbi:hypothetical protein [Paenibacillus illinoisensis]|uniref:hypothetical protein n=1 Tax=Paenibacillus illinoisensis TaxID=59845 RepID=UPI003CF43AA5